MFPRVLSIEWHLTAVIHTVRLSNANKQQIISTRSYFPPISLRALGVAWPGIEAISGVFVDFAPASVPRQGKYSPLCAPDSFMGHVRPP